MSTDHLHLPVNIQSDDEFGQRLEHIEDAVIRPIVRRKLHVTLRENDTSQRNQDALELVSEIRLSLVAELRKNTTRNGGIRDISAYAATVAFNACYQHFRSRYPQLTRLRNKLRYLLNHESEFALWRDSNDRWLCGLAAWAGRADQVGSVEAMEVADNELTEIGSGALLSMFVRSGSPLLFDELVNNIAAAHGLIRDTEAMDELGTLPHLSDPQIRIDAVVELTSRLNALWGAVLELPTAHRKALLFNLRDNSGDNLLAALPLTGVATIRQIAEAVDMTFEQLAEIWNSLPWEDNCIAEHLGLTRQQVINLRQTARNKLLRWRKETGNI